MTAQPEQPQPSATRTLEMMAIGATADVHIKLPGNKKFALCAEVMRIDKVTGELGIRFASTEIDLGPIDRLVCATVKRQKVAEE